MSADKNGMDLLGAMVTRVLSYSPPTTRKPKAKRKTHKTKKAP